jgi:hypothetical protein
MEMTMRTLHSDEERFGGGMSIFLAGPTPRHVRRTGLGAKWHSLMLKWGVRSEAKSWRPEAVRILQELGFEGTVLIPERSDWSAQFDYTDQVEWEYAGLSGATVTIFWVPREMKQMPALTTNVEFGFWIAKNADKVLYGCPNGAASVRYLDWLYGKCTGRTPRKTLESLLRDAVTQCAATVPGGELIC